MSSVGDLLDGGMNVVWRRSNQKVEYSPSMVVEELKEAKSLAVKQTDSNLVMAFNRNTAIIMQPIRCLEYYSRPGTQLQC